MSDFDPEEWLTVAELCCRSEFGEAYLRTAVNRAYYAALLSTKHRIEQTVGVGSVPRVQTHATILNAVRTGGREFEPIHNALRKLKQEREAVDYEVRNAPLQRWRVRSQVRLSRDVIRNHIKALPDAAFRTLMLSQPHRSA